MPDSTAPENKPTAKRSLLTDAVKHVDLVHTTLIGMAGIVIMLFVAALLPVVGYQPVTQVSAAVVMGIAAFGGMGVLYAINFRVHKHVTAQARLTEVLVNSLGQGFLTFDSNAVCGLVYSQACLDVLECVPTGKNLADVLHVPTGSREDFMGWIGVLFDPTHALGFDDAVRFLPQNFMHSGGRNIALAYKPILNAQENLTHIVVIATDRTEETEAQELAEQRQQFANMICKIFKERNQFITTISHIRDFIALTARSDLTMTDIPNIMRQLHTLKAAVRHFNLIKFGEIIHTVESQMRDTEITTEIDLQLIAATTHDVIETEFSRVLVEVRDLIGIDDERRGTVYEIGEDKIYAYANFLQSVQENPLALHRYLTDIAALPVRGCFMGFERELIELSQQMDKNLKPVSYTGTDVPVLALPLQDFFFSMTHMSRNIIDHGIEPPVTRMARNKDAAGLINVHTELQTDAAQQQWLLIEVSDDGAGIDPSRVRQKLAAIDPEGSWRFEGDHEVIQRIFAWGVSTRDGVSEISGRGVGLEAVMREVQKLGGTMSVESEIYRGTKFKIKVPCAMSV